MTASTALSSEVRCAHCRQPKGTHAVLIATFQMHHHIWQPSVTAWQTQSHDCPICLHEYVDCCSPGGAR